MLSFYLVLASTLLLLLLLLLYHCSSSVFFPSVFTMYVPLFLSPALSLPFSLRQMCSSAKSIQRFALRCYVFERVFVVCLCCLLFGYTQMFCVCSESVFCIAHIKVNRR